MFSCRPSTGMSPFGVQGIHGCHIVVPVIQVWLETLSRVSDMYVYDEDYNVSPAGETVLYP